MSKPVLLKLGGAVLTDKAAEPTFRRSVARRLLGEIAKAGVPTVLFHGAGSFGHPVAARAGIGTKPVGPDGRAAVAEILAGVAMLHGHVLHAAVEAGLKPMSVPIHLRVRREGDQLVNLPVERVHALLAEGFAPVLAGTLVRDDRLGWGIASADQLLAAFAQELRSPWQPRMAIFATDVDGLYDRNPAAEGAQLIGRLAPTAAVPGAHVDGAGPDVTGAMDGKVRQARTAAVVCPTMILNGNVRGRLQDALKGKAVPGTRVDAA